MSKIDSILVLGSGKMAENIGFFFLAKGLSVSWASPSKERLERLAKKAERLRRRFQRVDGTEKPGGADFLQFPFKPQSAYQLCIEASHEDLAHKRKLLGHLDELVGDSTLLVTTSSSILPEKIHPRCLGCHFFYPLELSPAVELISGAGHGREKINNLANFLESYGLTALQQDNRSAFLANRLLLPLQCLAMELLLKGEDPQLVDQHSTLGRFPAGMLTMMDGIGLDVVAAAVANFRFFPFLGSGDPGSLERGLAEVVAMGKRGKKNRDGLLCGAPLPWPEAGSEKGSLIDMNQRFQAAWDNALEGALAIKGIKKKDLNRLLELAFCYEVER